MLIDPSSPAHGNYARGMVEGRAGAAKSIGRFLLHRSEEPIPSPSAILFAISNGEREQSKSPRGREGSLITAEKSLCGNLPVPTFPFSVFVMKLPLNVVDLTRPRTRNIDSLFQLAREKRLFE